MNDYLFSQNVSLNLLPYIDNINFYFHINTIDWPIVHGHKDYWEFTVVTGGTIENRKNGERISCTAGSMFASSTKVRHSLITAEGKNARYINILVKESFMNSILNTLFRDDVPAFFTELPVISVPNSVIAETEEILSKVDYSLPAFYKEHDKLVCSAFLLLLSHVITTVSATSISNSPWQTALNKLSQSAELLSFNVNDVCEKLGYSRTQLNALFKKNYGVSPHEYLINYKFSYAKQLLLNTNMTVSDIAYKIGYSNTIQFYNTFKKIFGVTPARFRAGRKR